MVERSPFLFLATCLEDGHADVSPRGDPRGFVHRLGERTLLVPDRPGNRLVDNYRNVLAHPTAALLFVVPGSGTTARVTGRATLVKDPALLAPLAHQGKAPLLGLAIEIAEARVEESPALAASGAWDAAAHLPRRALPTLGRMLLDQLEPDGKLNAVVAKGVDLMLNRDVKTNLY